jgi:H+/Cl- antiporter ClcA
MTSAYACVLLPALLFDPCAGVENIAGFKFWVTLTLLDRRQMLASYLVYVLINCSLIVGSVALTVYVAPAAAGSGIAEVKVGMVKA